MLAGSLVALMLFSCTENEERGSLNDITLPSTPQPTVSGISPAGTALAGVDTLTISGSNFSSDISKTIVYFESTPGTILQASTTQLVVLPPLVLGDSVRIRIATQESDQMSPTQYYQLRAAAVEFGNLSPTETAGGVTTDASGNLYVGIAATGVDQGVFQYTPAGVKTQHAPPTAGTANWNTLTYGKAGIILAARNIRAIYNYAAGGGSSAAVWKAFPTGTSIGDVDYDASGNVWGIGNNTSIFCVKTDMSHVSYAFNGNVRSVRVFNGFLYFSATANSESKIYRAQITGDAIGTPEVVFDFTATFGTGRTALGLAIASDGTMFVGTEAPQGVVIIYPSGAYSAPFGSYSSLFGTSVKHFAWGAGDALYAVTNEGGLIQIAARKTSAPYYGAQ